MTRLCEFRPGLWLTELQLEEFAVRGAVILGNQRAAVWDTLSHPRDLQPVAQLLARRDFLLIYSHADWDHVWGTAGLPFSGRMIWAHEACRARFAGDVPAELQQKKNAEPGKWDEVVLVPPTHVFASAQALDLGGVSLWLHHLPGHTRDSIVGLLPEWGVLLAGDAVETPFPLLNAGSPLDLWMTALQRWAEDGRVQHVIPAHGEIGGRELLRQNLAYLRGLREGATAAPPADLDPFYRTAHRENLRLAQKLA
ncbi:MAG: MBL fold metallo-hydrolase [candidate division KSB1 bacterium]|nr:MBL fold metallo-hydrolase [candidate division KSB1 bacterium]MDZ7272620.1 MBL fold metallo-hydrolase [candidate division KSB1 bacterium]MDZ7284357.1 MBL fold metallo-hydrolase [candidate division KSB1 bacterium]MDZ7297247.1 MBL fold metallo-hydrolase [candidate division KSB1 bacterium]MDZ7308314.1 MBL fold metallo-hydrolase [candidate division KSB1 bacterium]